MYKMIYNKRSWTTATDNDYERRRRPEETAPARACWWKPTRTDEAMLRRLDWRNWSLRRWTNVSWTCDVSGMRRRSQSPVLCNRIIPLSHPGNHSQHVPDTTSFVVGDHKTGVLKTAPSVLSLVACNPSFIRKQCGHSIQLGEVGKFITRRCQISSPACTEKSVKSDVFWWWSYSKKVEVFWDTLYDIGICCARLTFSPGLKIVRLTA